MTTSLEEELKPYVDKTLPQLVEELNALSMQPIASITHFPTYTFSFTPYDTPQEELRGTNTMCEIMHKYLVVQANKESEGVVKEDTTVQAATGEQVIDFSKSAPKRPTPNIPVPDAARAMELYEGMSEEDQQEFRTNFAKQIIMRRRFPPSTCWIATSKNSWRRKPNGKWERVQEPVPGESYMTDFYGTLWFGDGDKRNRGWKNNRYKQCTKVKALIDTVTLALKLAAQSIRQENVWGESVVLVVDAHDIFIERFLQPHKGSGVPKDRVLYDIAHELFYKHGTRVQFVISDIKTKHRGFNLEEEMLKERRQQEEIERKKQQQKELKPRARVISWADLCDADN